MFQRVSLALVLAVTAVKASIAQSGTSFEVATIRPSSGIASDGSWSPPGTGGFTARSLPLARLIMLAYGIEDDQIANKPAWLEADLFDVAAKPSGNISLSREELKPLLQSLLRERFHLVIHTETRPMPGYALIVAKGGPRLRPTRGAAFPNFRVNVNDSEIDGLNWSMRFLATQLQRPAGRPVADATGLEGGYDIKLSFSSEVPTDSSLPSIFTALKETLGLKLEPRKIPVQVLVIDHADRTPTEN